MLNSLSNAEWSVIKGLALQGGSTSETIAYGFVTGDLNAFKQAGYVKFTDAWLRLDGNQQLAVMLIWAECQVFPGGDDCSLQSFVETFIQWKKQRLTYQYERKYWDANLDDENDDLPPDEQAKALAAVKRKLQPHL